MLTFTITIKYHFYCIRCVESPKLTRFFKVDIVPDFQFGVVFL